MTRSEPVRRDEMSNDERASELIMHDLRFALAALFAWICWVAPRARAQGQLWVVDDGGNFGAHFTDIQPAVSAAQDGDTVLVHEGEYGPVTIDGKALVVLNASFLGVNLRCGELVVRNLLPSQEVSVRGFGPDRVLLQSNAGSVLLEQVWVGQAPLFSACNLRPPALPATAVDALRVEACAAVTTARCRFVGMYGEGTGARGMYVEHSNLYMHGTSAFGGTPSGANAMTGGPALECVDSFVFVSGWRLHGGCGPAGASSCAPGGAGGPAVFVARGPAPLLQGVDLHAGLGGCSPSFPQCGSCGSAGELAVGGYELLPGAGRSLEALGPAPGGQSVLAKFSGAPGDLVIYALSLELWPSYLPVFTDALALPLPPLLLFTAGVAGQFGNLFSALQVPVLPPGVGALPVYLQAAGVTSAGEVGLSSPTLLAIL